MEGQGSALSIQYDLEGLYFLVEQDGLDLAQDRLFIPMDLTPKSGSTVAETLGISMSAPADFVIELNGTENSRVWVQSRYHTIVPLYASQIKRNFHPYWDPPAPDDGRFHPIHMLLRERQYYSGDQQIPFSQYKYVFVLERFHRYQPYLQESLLDFFRMNHWDVAALCMRLMQDPKTNQQVHYTAMRYFAKFPCEASDAFFLRVLAEPNQPWLDQMLAIQGLAQNHSPAVRTAIKAKITSPDWYVRLNAAEYLHQHDLTQQEIDEILALRDRYSAEILRYCCRNDLELTGYIDALLLHMYRSPLLSRHITRR